MNDNKKMVRIGKISSVNVERMRARVVFEDKDSKTGELVSAELPLLTNGAGQNKHYFNYRVGEEVVCVFPVNDDDGSGYIVGSYNHDESELRANDMHVTRFDFGDKLSVEYNEESGDVEIKIGGNVRINVEKDITINLRGEEKITATGEIILQGKNIRLN